MSSGSASSFQWCFTGKLARSAPPVVSQTHDAVAVFAQQSGEAVLEAGDAPLCLQGATPSHDGLSPPIYMSIRRYNAEVAGNLPKISSQFLHRDTSG